MSNTADAIRALLQAAFEPDRLQVEDESWKHAGHAGAREYGGGHFVVHITSIRFDGLPRSLAHRLIYRALTELFPFAIHALSIHIIPSER
jgi:BolA protein